MTSLIPQIKTAAGYFFYSIFSQEATFTFRGNSYHYLHRWYNATWRNERSIEVPIIWQMVSGAIGMHILEVGNVLSHYYPTHHQIVDKYEKAAGVINQDILDFSPPKPYDLIITISTIEHVGWDEPEKDVHKALKAIEHLKALLAPGGRLALTAPLGHNPYLDRAIQNQQLTAMEITFLRKVARPRLWHETDLATLKQAWPGYDNSTAQAIIVATYQKAA